LAGSQAPALDVIHKSVRVEIFRGIRVILSLLEKEASRKARKGAKKSDFLCAFASLRETCPLELSNIHVFWQVSPHLCITTRTPAWEPLSCN